MHAAAGLALFFLPATAAAASPPATSVLSLAEAEALEVKIGADAELARRRLQTGDEGLLGGGPQQRSKNNFLNSFYCTFKYCN